MFKKILLIAAFTSGLSLLASAKGVEDLRIYINPGHGGWTGDDRPCSLVNHPDAFRRVGTDTCSFFESNTDLEKGFGLLERLIQYGLKFDRSKNQTGVDHTTGAARDLEQNIVMSRVKNGPFLADNATAGEYGSGNVPAQYYWFNRNLTEICEEVQVNNFDMFISIHSNAMADGSVSNYPLYLYRGYDDCRAADGNTVALQTTSRRMAEICWDYGYENPHAFWSHFKTSKYVKGDIDFYGDYVTATRSDGTRVRGYLGALRHSVPGFLVEGFFHTYQPARHRAMNWDVCRVEGIGYAHGIADYFGIEKESTGTIYGIVRDASEKFTHTWYKPAPESDDIYKPINGATVVLKQGESVLASYTTDDYYNGAFVFDNLAPGVYTIEVSHPSYASYNNTQQVEVKAATVAYPRMFIEQLPPYRKAAMAYGLGASKKDGAGYDITYSLSADAERAQIVVWEADKPMTEIAGDSDYIYVMDVENTTGQHTFVLPDNIEDDCNWGVRLTPFANTDAGEIFAENTGYTDRRGGVVVITDEKYPSFGYTLVAHSMNGGIDIYDPSGAKVGDKLWRGHSLWGTSASTSRSDPFRGHEREGKAVFASWGDGACGIVAVDPFAESEPQSMYSGSMYAGGHFIHNGINVGGGVSGFCFLGEGENTRLYSFSEDHQGLNGIGSTENTVVRYDVGTGWLIEDAPQIIGYHDLFANTNVELVACRNGFFAAQNRAAGFNTPDIPGFAYIEADGHSVTFNSGVQLPELKSCTTGIAANIDGSLLAVSDESAINIYDMKWDGDTPRLAPAYKIPLATKPGWMHLRFDAAGNLHSYQMASGGYHVYALKNSGTSALYTSQQLLEGDATASVGNIAADSEEAATVLYNMTGTRVSEGNAAPGIYLKVSNGKAEKIVIK